ncbi:hypothetical protein GCM10009804_29640 [Kribbella hippodromi]|uniref:Secreted protein n=1 Tax=Kribbella hippodromi TaxID=434347 RepID=A0ABN2D8X9_9ACTN
MHKIALGCAFVLVTTFLGSSPAVAVAPASSEPTSVGAVRAKKCGGHFKHWYGGDFLFTNCVNHGQYVEALKSGPLHGTARACVKAHTTHNFGGGFTGANKVLRNC